MNAQKIFEYIAALEKSIQARVDKCADLKKENRKLQYKITALESQLADYYESDSDSVNGDIRGDSDYDSETESVNGGSEYVSDDESVASNESYICGNCKLAEHFYSLAAKQDNPRKKDAFCYVGDLVKNLNFDVTCGEDVAHFKGVGKKSVRIIDDFLNEK